MAHENYLMLISQSLDGELATEEKHRLDAHIDECAHCADMWTNLAVVHHAFSAPVMAAPKIDLTAAVMARVETYESRKRYHPYLWAGLALLSTLTALSLAAPTLFFVLGLQNNVMDWPIVGTLITNVAKGFALIVAGASFAMDALLAWFNYLFTDPVALAVVLTALTSVSIYIGVRETMKVTRQSQLAAQAVSVQ